MTRKEKLRRLLGVLSNAEDGTDEGFRAFDDGVAKLKKNLKEKIQTATLDEVNTSLDRLRKNVDITPLLDAVDQIKTDFEKRTETLVTFLEDRTNEVETSTKQSGEAVSTRTEGISKTVDEMRQVLEELSASKLKESESMRGQVVAFGEEAKVGISALEERLTRAIKAKSTDDMEGRKIAGEEVKALKVELEKLRKDLIQRIGNIGGGNMNRQIKFGGVDYLTKYTDINWKAGANVTFTVAQNNTTKMVDVTVAATGGSGSGIVRSINSVAIDTTAGATASTDYVYLVSGTTTITLPTAVGNANLYTVKNVGTGVVTVATTSAQTIDGTTTITMPVQYTSVDVASDTANWNIT